MSSPARGGPSSGYFFNCTLTMTREDLTRVRFLPAAQATLTAVDVEATDFRSFGRRFSAKHFSPTIALASPGTGGRPP
jgi:hypothetical protein